MSTTEKLIHLSAQCQKQSSWIWNEKELNRTVNWIKSNGYKKVCLQFPDDWLHLR